MASKAIVFFLLLLVSVSPIRGDMDAWCVCPSTVHVLQRSTCQSLPNISSRAVEWQGMRGELEKKQILVDTRGWDPTANLTASVLLTSTDLVGVLAESPAGTSVGGRSGTCSIAKRLPTTRAAGEAGDPTHSFPPPTTKFCWKWE